MAAIAHRQVLLDRQAREDLAALRHVADAAAARAGAASARDVLAVEHDAPRADRQQAHQALEQRRLAHAVAPEHARVTLPAAPRATRPAACGCRRSTGSSLSISQHGRPPLSARGRPRSRAVVAHLVHRPLGQHAALVQHGDLARDAPDELHVVLDDEDGVPPGELQAQLGGLLGLLVGHAGDRLVEQQQRGSCDEHHADLEPLLLAVGQRAGDPVDLAAQVGHRERRLDPSELLASRAARAGWRRRPLVGLQRELQVLEHRQVSNTVGPLELAADAGLRDLRLRQPRQVDGLAEEHPAGVGPRLAGDHVHHRRLAGAVGADHAAQLAVVQVSEQVVERLEAVEADGDVLEVEDRPVATVARPGSACGRAPATARRRALARPRRRTSRAVAARRRTVTTRLRQAAQQRRPRRPAGTA